MNKLNLILESLREELRKGRLGGLGSRFPSEYELANRFDVSRVTANKAVTLLVNEGYLKRGVRGSGTKVHGVSTGSHLGHVLFLGNFVHTFIANILNGALQAAQSRNYGMEVLAPTPAELPSVLQKSLRTPGAVGLLSNGYGFLEELCGNFTVINLDIALPQYDLRRHNVANQNYKGANEMAKKILKAGHREIVIYTHTDYQCSHRFFRVHGFQDALREAGIPDVEKRLFAGLSYSRMDATTILRKIRTQYPDVTAILTTSDDLAGEMVVALQDAGITVPDAVVVTGFGNVKGISNVYHLPGVEQHPFELGATACNALLDIHEGKLPANQPVMQFVDVELVNLEFITQPTQKQ